MRTHERVGWGFFWIFAAGIIINAAIVLTTGIKTSFPYDWLVRTNYYWMVPCCVVFLLTTKYYKIRFFHVAITLGYGIITCFQVQQALIGVFYYIIGIGLMFQYGYLKRNFVWKAIPLTVALIAVIPISAIVHGHPINGELTDLTFVPLAFFAAIYVIFKDKLQPLVVQPAIPVKRKIVLKDHGVTGAKAIIIHCVAKGMEDKEIPDEVHKYFPTVNSIGTVRKYKMEALRAIGYQDAKTFLRDVDSLEII